ncbi:MAG: UvrD-helicase domain-containing protein [Rhodanobacter sp.]
MRYIAFTEAVANWLLGKAGLIDSLHRALISADATRALSVGQEFIEGPFHLAYSPDALVLGMWNADYLSGTGEEPWGFIRVSGELGIADAPAVSREVFERCLYVISQRLQGLTIDGAFFPRTCGTNGHTCLAGRGSEARQVSIAYHETVLGKAGQKQQAIVCLGPHVNWRALEAAADNAALELPRLVEAAGSLLASGRSSRVADPVALEDVRAYLRPFTKIDAPRGIGDVQVEFDNREIDEVARFKAASLSYEEWIAAASSLTEVQRRILLSDAVEQHPIRIVGPGGSGKTLLMQLLAVRQMLRAANRGVPVRIIYLVHNREMARTVRHRFEVLASATGVTFTDFVDVKTLSEVARELLELDDAHVIDTDAHEAKAFQFDQVKRALEAQLEVASAVPQDSRLLCTARDNPRVMDVLAVLIMSEISVAIKGQGLSRERRKYVQSARPLSRFHGAMTEREREFVFKVFEAYHAEVFESLEVLDSDDLAISLLGRLRTPIWDLRRRQQGYDYIFVDETQLFNENERRVIPLLSNALQRHMPVVLALDEAQSIYGLGSAGFAALGIEGMTSESLSSIHRSVKSVIELAFFVIQRSTDLFGADFPDFTNIADKIESDHHPLAAKPRIEQVPDQQQSFGKFILKRVRELRRANIRQIAVVVHADQYWDAVLAELSKSDLPLQVVLTRGQKLPLDQPLVAITRPAYVGGQEFDAVILVGLEQGVVPPRMGDSEALSTAVEQQVLREMYVSITRARYQVVVALSQGAAPNAVLLDAVKHGVLSPNKLADL